MSGMGGGAIPCRVSRPVLRPAGNHRIVAGKWTQCAHYLGHAQTRPRVRPPPLGDDGYPDSAAHRTDPITRERGSMTTLFLATTGGHLTQLAGIADRIPHDPDSLWVTHANPQSESLLADRDVHYVPYIGVRDVLGVLECVPRAWALYRRR